LKGYPTDVSNKVIFRKFDILADDVIEDKFDSLVVINTLERSFHQSNVLDKIDCLIENKGRLLFCIPLGKASEESVPFVRSTYGFSTINLISNRYSIEDLDFIRGGPGNHRLLMCITCRPGGQSSGFKLSNIYNKIERELLQRELEQQSILSATNNFLVGSQMMRSLERDYAQIPFPQQYGNLRGFSPDSTIRVKELEGRLAEANSRVESLKKEIEEQKNRFRSNENKMLDNSNRYEIVKKENEELASRLKDLAGKLNKELKEEERILRAYDTINREYNRIFTKYENLAETPWGKLTLEYWRFLNNRPRKN
jgi:hypothetical protein